jgi:hypothetical protein
MNNMTKSTDNVTTTPSGVLPPLTRHDVMVFNTLLLKCRGLDVSRRIQKGDKVATDPDVEIIRAFCRQALQDAQSLALGKSPEEIIKGGAY